MTQGWDFGSDNKGGSSEKVEFTKFPVGITRIRIVDDSPHTRWVHWLPQFKRSINCPGRGCPICDIMKQQKANGEKSQYTSGRRLAMQVINRDTGKLEIMEQGITFFEDVRDLMTDLKEEGKSLYDVDLKVRRRGTGKDDTTYRVDIDEAYPLSDADKTLMENKLDLNEYFKPTEVEKITRLVRGESWEDVMMAKDEDETPASTPKSDDQDGGAEEYELK